MIHWIRSYDGEGIKRRWKFRPTLTKPHFSIQFQIMYKDLRKITVRLILGWQINGIGPGCRRMSEFGVRDKALGPAAKVLIT
jgi:hypothetical protein